MLNEGDVIEIMAGHAIYADVPKHFVYSNKRGCYEITHHNITVGDEFDYFIGEYIVIKTSMDGGGEGHGPGDYYPSGHHVWCVKANDKNVRIDFYQSGAFTAMIEDITPIGKATLNWTLEG